MAHRPTARLVSRSLSVVAFAVSIGIVAMLPRFVGQSWAAVGALMSGVSVPILVALAALWLAGLLVHTTVLTAAMPGLSTRRALLLNLSGSAVSNLFPFGGAAGMGLGWVMTRSWRFSPASYASYTAISNVWNVLAKLMAGSAILGAALLFGLRLPAGFTGIVTAGALGMFLAMVAVAGVFASAKIAGPVGGAIDRVGNALFLRTGRPPRLSVRHWILRTREQSATTVADGWTQLTFGVLAYMFLQFVLLWACLFAVDAHATLLVVAVTFGVERLLSVLPFTPGGSGLTELGAVGVLVTMGVSPAEAAAGVLLYRLYTFLLEIPVGGVGALVWLRRHHLTTHGRVPA